jgi:hypothetical protein
VESVKLRALSIAFMAMAGFACAEVQSLAIFVGVDEGLAEERALKYASRDAEDMAAVIRQLGPFDKDRIYLLTNPDLDRFRSTLEEVRGRVKEMRKAGVETLVLLYYSGHGSAEGLHLRGRNFPRGEINGILESLESNLKVVILDACESGDFLRRKGGKFLEDREIVKQDKIGSQGTIVLSSSSRGEAAQESEDYHGAVFSHHLENGLRGMADYNSDGQVTLLEAFEYARAATRAEEIMGQTERQNPSFDFDVVGETDPVLARLERKSSRISFEGMPAVGLEIFNAQTQEMERRVWLTGKPKAIFHLSSGKYLLRYLEKDGYRVGSLDLTWTPEAVVRPADFQLRPKSLLQRKGGAGFDLRMHGVQIMTRADLPADAPIFGAEYVLRDWPFKQSLGFGYGRAFSRGVGMDVTTQVYRLGYSVMRPMMSSPNGQISVGLEAAWQRLDQEVRDKRFGDSAIMAEGRPVSTRWESWSSVWSAGIPVELEIFLPWRLWIGASARGEAYRYRERVSGDYRYRLRVEPAMILGHQF